MYPCQRCRGLGTYAGAYCFGCKGEGTRWGGDPVPLRDLGEVAAILRIDPAGAFKASCATHHDAYPLKGMHCWASGLADTRREALLALGADLKRRGMTGVLKVVKVETVHHPHRPANFQRIRDAHDERNAQ